MLKLKRFPKKSPQIIAAVLSTLFISSHAYADGMIDLGTLGGAGSYARGVSGDGTVIVGYSSVTGNGATHAFKYLGTTMTDLGTLGGAGSYARGVSVDGSVIVGYSHITGNGENHAFKYLGTTMTDLGTLGGTNSYAYGVSGDGSVIVGNSQITGNGENHAFKYVGTTMTDLGTLGGTDSSAYGVSGDGSVIVGNSQITGNGAIHAFKYLGTTMTDLGTLGGTYSVANGVSGDGTVIVGFSNTTGDTAYHAFKYVGTTMTDLGTLGGTYSVANGVSVDGSVIVGYSHITGNAENHAFKYVGTTMTDLGTLGGTSSYANSISADGTVIVGHSQITGNTAVHAFVYRTSGQSGMVDVNNTYTALATNSYQLNSLLNTQANLLNVGLNHDCTVFGANNLCIAVGGAYSTVNQSTASQTTANLRVAYQLTPNLHIGAFVDQSASNSMPSNYDLKNDMPLMGAFASWSQNTNGTGTKIKGSIAYSKRDLDITRSVLANTEAGKGSSNLTTKGVQLEAAYGMALNDDWVSEPFAGVRVSQISRNSYQEHNVDFPISFNAVNQTATTAYVGARLIGQIKPAITARLSAGVESDIHHHISDHSGTINTLGSYALNAPDVLRTRGFLNGSLSYAISPTQAINAAVLVNQNALNHAVGATAMANYVIGF